MLCKQHGARGRGSRIIEVAIGAESFSVCPKDPRYGHGKARHDVHVQRPTALSALCTSRPLGQVYISALQCRLCVVLHQVTYVAQRVCTHAALRSCISSAFHARTTQCANYPPRMRPMVILLPARATLQSESHNRDSTAIKRH